MFLGRLCMEHYIIDHMLLEDKLKEISVKKWCVGSDTNRRIFIVVLAILKKYLNSSNRNSRLTEFFKLFCKFCLELMWYIVEGMNVRFI